MEEGVLRLWAAGKPPSQLPGDIFPLTCPAHEHVKLPKAGSQGRGGGLPLKYIKFKTDNESLTQHDIK